MINVKLTENKEIELDSLSEKVRVGDSFISGFNVELPETVGTHPIAECEVRLCAVLENGDTFAYDIDTSSSSGVVNISYDLTEREQDVSLFFEITSNGEAIGRTAAETLRVFSAPDSGEPLVSREELLSRCAELEIIAGKYDVLLDEVKGMINTEGTTLTIPEGVTKIGEYAFYFHFHLHNVTIPDTVRKIENYAFYDCYNLESVVVPQEVTSIGNCAFQKCSGLTSVQLPEGLISIGSNCFDENYFLTEIIMPSTVEKIGHYAFQNCPRLTTVRLNHGLTYLGGNVFNKCRQLRSLWLPNTLTTIEAYPFNNTGITELVLEDGFNANGLNLYGTNLSAVAVAAMFPALADRTGQEPYTITVGSTLLSQLTAEQKAIATSKNWILA